MGVIRYLVHRSAVGSQLGMILCISRPKELGSGAALHHVIKYLSKYPSLKLEYQRITSTPKGLDGLCDADWGNSSTRRSTTGTMFWYNGALISWRLKQQKMISLSKAEVEYYWASEGAVQALYISGLH
jgi:hypothetical protein